jgi:NagD protein
MERPMTNDQTSQTTESYLIDMNGVLVQDEQLLPGAEEFIAWLKATGRRFLVLTSDSVYTQRDLAARLARSGLDVPAEAIWTSAVATAQFLAEQRPEGTAYTLGEAGLTAALHEVGYILSERDPDYVVLGETRSYSLERLTLAIRLIVGGARFIATNPEPTGLSQQGLQPGTGAVAALISRATGIEPYIVMRSGLRAIGAHSASTVLIGDRMDTDIVAGIEAGMQAILVLSGVDKRETLDRFPYMPSRIVDSVADLLDTAGQASNTADTASDAASGSSR